MNAKALFPEAFERDRPDAPGDAWAGIRARRRRVMGRLQAWLTGRRGEGQAAWARQVAHVAETRGFSALSLPSPDGPGLAVRGNERVLLLGEQDADVSTSAGEALLRVADADAVWAPSKGVARRVGVVQYFPFESKEG